MSFTNYIPFVRRYESCVGISFPAIRRWKIEFWFAPSGYIITPHSHPDLDIELVFLIGHESIFYRERENKIEKQMMKWWKPFRKFTVKRNDCHWFSVSKYPLVFMNIEHWYSKPTSASESFKIA